MYWGKDVADYRCDESFEVAQVLATIEIFRSNS